MQALRAGHHQIVDIVLAAAAPGGRWNPQRQSCKAKVDRMLPAMTETYCLPSIS